VELDAVLDRHGQCGDLDDSPKGRFLIEVQVAGEEVGVDGSLGNLLMDRRLDFSSLIDKLSIQGTPARGGRGL